MPKRNAYVRWSLDKEETSKDDGAESIVKLHEVLHNKKSNKLKSKSLRSSDQILRHSDHYIEPSVGQKLKELIDEMETTEFIVGDVSPVTDGVKRTDIISQYQHFPNYLEIIEGESTIENTAEQAKEYSSSHYFDKLQVTFGATSEIKPDQKIISLAPTIFSIKEQKFMTEINGLSHAENKELYKLIQTIFIKFLPMFDKLLQRKLSMTFDNLSVIIKIQRYDIDQECAFDGHWHSEGNKPDDIMAVALYYFDISESESFHFDDHCLEIAHQKSGNATVKMKIKENDCVVFKNVSTKHRASFSTKKTNEASTACHASRSVLSFFLMDPRNELLAKTQSSECKWYNYPWKTDIFVQDLLGHPSNIYQGLIDLIGAFAFGNTEHRQSEISSYVKEYVLTDVDPNEQEPFPSLWRASVLGN